MEKPVASYEEEIRKYEETLSRDPSSYCFAPLAELHRKMGQHDAALAVAEKGVATHPDYVGGHLALGRAYLDKGMLQDARKALERVVNLTPDNLLAHRLLTQIYLKSDETSRAIASLKLMVANNPSDSESHDLLNFLQAQDVSLSVSLNEEVSSGQPSSFCAGCELDAAEDDADEILELEVIEDLEEVETSGLPSVSLQEPVEELPIEGYVAGADDECTQGSGSDALAPEIRTATIAEIYVDQGHVTESIGIYRELLAREPGNLLYAERLENLEARQASSISGEQELVLEMPAADESSPGNDIVTFSEYLPSEQTILEELTLPVTAEDSTVPLFDISLDGQESLAIGTGSDTGSSTDENPAGFTSDKAAFAGHEIEPVLTLVRWLENIRRIRTCHSGKY